MTNKQTNDSTFKSYGSFYDEPVDVQKHNLMRQEISSPSKKLTQLFVFSCEVYIECPLGVALILVSDSPEAISDPPLYKAETRDLLQPRSADNSADMDYGDPACTA